MMNSKILCMAFISVSMLLSGCTEYTGYPEKMVYPPTYPIDNVPQPTKTGSLYQRGHEVSLYDDRVATHVGDILTVRLEESTDGKKQAKTKSNKTASNTLAAPTLMSLTPKWMALDTNSDQEFDGEGQSNQNHQLNGTISVTVIRTLNNGNLVVQGESWVTINEGREYVRLTGIIRPDDIGPDNTVSSQRVAAAQISYSGYGQVGNASRGGVITQALHKFWPY